MGMRGTADCSGRRWGVAMINSPPDGPAVEDITGMRFFRSKKKDWPSDGQGPIDLARVDDSNHIVPHAHDVHICCRKARRERAERLVGQ